MFKQFLSGSLFFALLFASSLSAQAQPQQPTSKPQTPVVPQEQIAPKELQQFANAIKQLRVIQQDSMKEMTQVVKSEGLSEQRFVQIYEAQQNPNGPTTKLTSEEQQNFEQASTKIRDIQQKTQSKMEQAVKDAGLNVQRFNQISALVRQDTTLQQQVQRMIQS